MVKIRPATDLPQTERSSAQHYLRPGVLSLPSLPPLSLYVHIPWCMRKCPYCDFNSHEHRGGLAAIPEAAYLEALRIDLETSLPLIWGRPIVSVFIGGGTPSVFSAAGIEALLSDVRALLPLQADCEITLEANPGTFEAEKFAAFRAAGVNRLSIGIQSFDESKLRSLGRAHDRTQALAAAAAGQHLFENFNLAEIGLLSQFMQVYRADPGAEIIREGETGDCMVFLIDGRIEVFKQDRWNAPRLIALVLPGQSFGEMSMIDGEPRFASCVAGESCTIAVLSRDSLARIILEQATLGSKILMELVLMLSQRLRQTSSKLLGYMDREKADQGALPAV